MCDKKHTCSECPANLWVQCTVEKRKAHIAELYAKANSIEKNA